MLTLGTKAKAVQLPWFLLKKVMNHLLGVTALESRGLVPNPFCKGIYPMRMLML